MQLQSKRSGTDVLNSIEPNINGTMAQVFSLTSLYSNFETYLLAAIGNFYNRLEQYINIADNIS